MPAERIALALVLAAFAAPVPAADAPPSAPHVAPPKALAAEDAELFEFLGEFGSGEFVDPFALDAVAAELEAREAAAKPRPEADQEKPTAPAVDAAPVRRPEKDDG